MSWEEIKLGEFLTLQRGYDLPSSQRKDGQIPIVSSSGITGHHNAAKVAGPGVVTGRYGTLGEVFYLEEDFWPLNTALYVRDFNGNNPRFTAYFLKGVLKGAGSDKAAVPGVNRNDLHARKVRVTRNPRQQDAIVSVLAAYDDLIENNRRRIQLLEQAARLLYKEWFVHLRFPGHEHVRMIDGVPEGWERKPLGEVAATNRQSYRSGELPEMVNYIDISSVTQGQIATKTPISAVEAPGRARRKCHAGDVIWSNVRPNLRAYALVLDPDANDVFSTGFTVLSPTGVPFSYLYLLVTTDEFVGHLVNHTTGSSYPAVRPDDFERPSVLVPSDIVITLFHEIVAPFFRQVGVLRSQINPLAKARDLLLPRLMNGEISV